MATSEHLFTVRLSAETNEKLAQIAERTHRSKGDIVRLALDAVLEDVEYVLERESEEIRALFLARREAFIEKRKQRIPRSLTPTDSPNT